MPVRELTAIRREAKQLRQSLGAVSGLRPVYRLVELDGTETDPVDLDGARIYPGDDDVAFRVLAAPFRLLAEGKRHTVITHGRGSGIASTIGRHLLGQAVALGLAVAEPCGALCCREVRVSLRDSVWHLLVQLIAADPLLFEHFTIQRDSITGRNGSEFLFRGLQSAAVEGLKIVEGVSEVSLGGRGSVRQSPERRGRTEARPAPWQSM